MKNYQLHTNKQLNSSQTAYTKTMHIYIYAKTIYIGISILHPLKPKLNIIQELDLSHIGMSKMVYC